jgi:hypothetical protein
MDSTITDQNIDNNDGGQGQGGQAQSLGWRTELPEAQRGHEAFAQYQSKAELYKGVIDLHTANKDSVQKLTELEGKVNGSILLPKIDENATEEQRTAYRAELNKILDVPAKAEDYEIPVPEGSTKELSDAFRQFAFSKGLPKDMAKDTAEWFNGLMANIEKARDEYRQAEHDATMESNKKEWGTDYDKNAEIVKVAYDHFKTIKGFPDLLNLQIGGTPEKPVTLGNHPLMSALFLEIGKKIVPDSIIPGSNQATSQGPPDRLTYTTVKT